MAALQEKLDRESGNKIYLYKQGALAAYEHSALILSRHRQLKISMKIVKKLAQQVVSVGFLAATLVGIG